MAPWGYDEEIEDEWNKRFNKLTTLSGEEWRKIWENARSDDNINNGFTEITCNKTYLKEIIFDGTITKLTYESFVVGKTNYLHSSPNIPDNQFIKLSNEFLTFELTFNQSPKITNLKFLTKNSEANEYEGLVLRINDDIRMVSRGIKLPNDKRLISEYKKLKSDIINASSICKNY